MVQYTITAGVRLRRRHLLKLTVAEKIELAASESVGVRRPVEWSVTGSIPNLRDAYVDPGGTDVFGPGPFLKVPNRPSGEDWEAVNRVFCPWGYPPDRVRISRSNRYPRIIQVRLVQDERACWHWLLTLEVSETRTTSSRTIHGHDGFGT